MGHIQFVEDDNWDFVTVTTTGPKQDEQPAVVLLAPELTVMETPTPTSNNEDGEDGLRFDTSLSSPWTDSEVLSSKEDSTGLLDSVCSVCTEPLDDDPVTTRTLVDTDQLNNLRRWLTTHVYYDGILPLLGFSVEDFLFMHFGP